MTEIVEREFGNADFSQMTGMRVSLAFFLCLGRSKANKPKCLGVCGSHFFFEECGSEPRAGARPS